MLVPGGGPAIDGSGWITTKHPTQRNRKKPYLTDNVELGRLFRKKFVNGLRRLVRQEKLKLQDAWEKLQDNDELEAWLDEIVASDWNVFIEGPPHGKSNPVRVLKYLARYMSGGPISDRRIIRDENDRVTFWARSKNKSNGNQPRPFTLDGKQFVRRWSMHIQPKGYTQSRHYGGYHGRSRKKYIELCKQLLTTIFPAIAMLKAESAPSEPKKDSTYQCLHCDTPMKLIEQHRRPSWKIIFDRRVYDDRETYCALLHIASRAPPAFPFSEDDHG